MSEDARGISDGCLTMFTFRPGAYESRVFECVEMASDSALRALDSVGKLGEATLFTILEESKRVAGRARDRRGKVGECPLLDRPVDVTEDVCILKVVCVQNRGDCQRKENVPGAAT
jgi:hypothetical protein